METLLSGNKLNDELEFFKRHLDIVAAQKVKHPATYVPPLQHRPKRATLANIPVCEPPAAREEDEQPVGLETIKISIKSLKPSLVFSLSCPSTSTIGSLKSLLSQQEASAPAPERQRWILKGKAMGDDKLIREFAIKDGAVVNLMITKAVAKTEEDGDEPPSITLTTGGSGSGSPKLSLAIPATPVTAPAKLPADVVISSPALWIDVLALLRSQFADSPEGERNAVSTWESWLSASIDRISASDKALIRERAKVSAMGGL